MIDSKRITILDGLRVIAIVMVLLYHYYFRFLESHYHYSFKTLELFKYGYLGVELFFIISGFVITLTLTKCNSFLDFIKKRFIRLIPAMLVCSALTFLFMSIFDDDFLFEKSSKFINLIVSNTFISPQLINLIFNSNTDYIDGAYWSLWAEIVFYIIAGILYFISQKKMLLNFSIVTFSGVIFFFLAISNKGMQFLSPLIGSTLYMNIRQFFKIFTFFEYGLWFLLGMILNKLYYNKESKWLLFYFTIVFVFQTILLFNFYISLFSLFTYIVLLCFIYKPEMIAILGNHFFSKLGLVSYSVYLIHQNIGVLIINKFSNYLGNYSWLIAIILIIIFFLFGLLSYKYLETSISKLLKNVMFR